VLTSGNTHPPPSRTNAELMHELTDFRNKYQIQTLIQRNSQFDEATGDKTRLYHSTAGQSGWAE
jgi:putative salt-induced outer membrane protein